MPTTIRSKPKAERETAAERKKRREREQERIKQIPRRLGYKTKREGKK